MDEAKFRDSSTWSKPSAPMTCSPFLLHVVPGNRAVGMFTNVPADITAAFRTLRFHPDIRLGSEQIGIAGDLICSSWIFDGPGFLRSFDLSHVRDTDIHGRIAAITAGERQHTQDVLGDHIQP